MDYSDDIILYLLKMKHHDPFETISKEKQKARELFNSECVQSAKEISTSLNDQNSDLHKIVFNQLKKSKNVRISGQKNHYNIDTPEYEIPADMKNQLNKLNHCHNVDEFSKILNSG